MTHTINIPVRKDSVAFPELYKRASYLGQLIKLDWEKYGVEHHMTGTELGSLLIDVASLLAEEPDLRSEFCFLMAHGLGEWKNAVIEGTGPGTVAIV